MLEYGREGDYRYVFFGIDFPNVDIESFVRVIAENFSRMVARKLELVEPFQLQADLFLHVIRPVRGRPGIWRMKGQT